MSKKDIPIKDCGSVVSRIVVENDWGRLRDCCGQNDSVFLVYDINVIQTVMLIRSAVHVKAELALEVSELNKSVDSAVAVCSWLLENGADRNSLLLALGGGILTDMAGFAAAIYKRGIRVAYIPTTLLAQVDASIGGKTGVNLETYKNMIGVIRQPEFTYVCPTVLATLSDADFLSGAAEMLKTFIIEDGGFYKRAVDFFASYRRSGKYDAEELEELIYAAAKVKACIVSEDQFEGSVRKKLNLGHTFAHAIESVQCRKDGFIQLSHGQAVSVGIVMASELSEAIGIAGAGLAKKLSRDLRSCGLPVSSSFSAGILAGVMEKDKKSENGKVNFVLIEKIGSVVTRSLKVSEVVNKLKEYDLHDIAE